MFHRIAETFKVSLEDEIIRVGDQIDGSGINLPAELGWVSFGRI